MYQLISSVRSVAKATAVVLVSGIIFLSCKKESNDNANIPVAALMAFNLSPDQNAAGFTISGNSLTNNPLGYTSFTGAYLNIYPGQRQVDAYDFYNNRNSALASMQSNFETGKYYSIFLVGIDSNYKNVVVNDNLDTLSGSSGQAFIRYVNAIPDSVSIPAVTVTSNGNSVSTNPAAFASVSAFIPVPPGDINIAVKNAAGIDANRTITVEQRKIYTVLLIGVPGSATTPVEIKYITNGILSGDSTAKTSAIALTSN